MKLLIVTSLLAVCASAALFPGKNVVFGEDGLIHITAPTGLGFQIARPFGPAGERYVDILATGPDMAARRFLIGDKIGHMMDYGYGKDYPTSQGDLLADILRRYQGTVDDATFDALLQQVRMAVARGQMDQVIFELLQGLHSNDVTSWGPWEQRYGFEGAMAAGRPLLPFSRTPFQTEGQFGNIELCYRVCKQARDQMYYYGHVLTQAYSYSPIADAKDACLRCQYQYQMDFQPTMMRDFAPISEIERELALGGGAQTADNVYDIEKCYQTCKQVYDKKTTSATTFSPLIADLKDQCERCQYVHQMDYVTMKNYMKQSEKMGQTKAGSKGGKGTTASYKGAYKMDGPSMGYYNPMWTRMMGSTPSTKTAPWTALRGAQMFY